jgi:hypothetical protein
MAMDDKCAMNGRRFKAAFPSSYPVLTNFVLMAAFILDSENCTNLYEHLEPK